LKLGCECCRKGDIGVLFNFDAKLFCHTLQEGTVAGGALVGEAKVLHHAVLQKEHFDVLTADVTDDVDALSKDLLRTFHVGDGLDDVGVGLECAFKRVCVIPGNAEPFYVIVVVRVLGFDLL